MLVRHQLDELTAAMALIQTLVVALAMIVLVAVTRRVSAHIPSTENAMA